MGIADLPDVTNSDDRNRPIADICLSCENAVMSERTTSVLLNFSALLVGALVAIISVTTYEWLMALPDERAAIAEGSSLLVSAASKAQIAALMAALTAIPIIAVCLPIWLVLAKFRKNNWIAAAALGITSTVGAWVVLFDLETPLSDALIASLPYGICGALAGVTTWWASPGRRVSAASAN
jgi:hypothetical protein